jgi:uncharacterized protein (TIRG00374 family)
MGRLLKRLVLGLVIGLGLYAAGAIYLGVSELWTSLGAFALWRLAPVLALTLGNYLLRYAKWSLYLRTLGIAVPPGRNLIIFLSGLSMVVTPGKIGELLKAYLLKTAEQVPMARTVPVVLAERITDLLALVLLMLAGIATFKVGRVAVAVVGGLVAAFVVVVSSRRLCLWTIGLVARLPRLGRLGPKLREFYESTALLFRPLPLLAATVLSVAAWLCECVGFHLVLGGLAVSVPLLLSVFIYSATTIGGLPTPGGLGLTEGGMTALLRYAAGADKGIAGAATLIIRLCTLWFAVIVGVVALVIFRRAVGLAADAAERMSAEG